jgi:hypothetical protein
LNFSLARALWRPSGQNGPSLHRVISEAAFQKKELAAHDPFELLLRSVVSYNLTRNYKVKPPFILVLSTLVVPEAGYSGPAPSVVILTLGLAREDSPCRTSRLTYVLLNELEANTTASIGDRRGPLPSDTDSSTWSAASRPLPASSVPALRSAHGRPGGRLGGSGEGGVAGRSRRLGVYRMNWVESR